MFPSVRSGRCSRIVLVAALLVAARQAGAQIDTAPVEGLRDNTPRYHALTNAHAVVAPGREIEAATIVLRDGVIEAIGSDVTVPGGARIWDLAGKRVYAGFIDAMSELGLPAGLREPRPPLPDAGPPPAPPEPAADGFWNARIRPETNVAALLELDADEVETLRSAGLTTVLAVPRRGILRGGSAVLALADPGRTGESVLAARAAQHAGIELAQVEEDYPSSLMGAIALMRQAFYDARWYDEMRTWYAANPEAERPAENAALAALAPVIGAEQLVIYATDDELDYARALAIADEFDLDLALYGNGYEYRRIGQLDSLARPLIVPLDFPDAPDVATPDGALEVSLETLQHWELAPSNPAFLAAAGVPFALTADGLDDVAEELWDNVRLAVERGLPADVALAALTTVPAGLLGLADRLGTLEPGRIGNLVVADADLFTDEDAEIELVFVDGEPYALDGFDAPEAEGRWQVSWLGGSGEWILREAGRRLRLAIGDESYRAELAGEELRLFPDAAVFGAGEGIARLAGYIADGSIDGIGELPDGSSFGWTATRLGEAPAADGDAGASAAAAEGSGALAGERRNDSDAAAAADVPALVAPAYPAGAFGQIAAPGQPEALLVRNATIWTSGPAGRLENADLLVRSGRITAVGPNLTAPRNAVIVDATGKHVTPGLVDAHSHTAISRGINEVGSAITVEVQIEDVLDPTDINIYRQLAGGLTTANVMHGSANPMGGQVRTIKLRWGGDAAGLLFAGADPGVKFALGENVKQSNWGEQYTTRYPQTRMGVDEIIRDTFDAARAYGEARANRRRNDPPVRRNLRLDAALEILNRERRIHVHSYRQDEILAFVRLAEAYSLDVAAFQHVLEGYKVGPEIASIGAGGSTFSDWWGYKYEVIDAVPYNGALMREAGVVVSFNSDDDELATRLNTEAAKAVKYGKVPEVDALGFVTINPAIQLGIDDRVGSLEPGKDADFVIWSGDPLSTFTRAEQTWIDGRKYFDIAEDARMRMAAAAERARLIQAVLARDDGDDEAGGSAGPRDSSDTAGIPPDPGNGASVPNRGRQRLTDSYSSAVERSHAIGGDHE